MMMSLKKISTGSNSSTQSSVGEAVSMETSSDSNNNGGGCNSIENDAGERRKSDTLGGGDGRSVMNFKMNTGCADDLALFVFVHFYFKATCFDQVTSVARAVDVPEVTYRQAG